MKVSIIVPAYDEEEVIGEFLKEAIQNIKLDDYELLFVNDGSKDKTENIIQAYSEKDKRIRLINHPKNLGLGRALSTGFKEATGEIIVTMDADLTHPPYLISPLVNEMIKTNSDVAIASRYVQGGGMKNVPFYRVLISKIANGFIYLLKGVHDGSAGFKAYRSNLIKEIEIERNDFSVQLEIVLKLKKMDAKFCEIPLMLETRKIGKSKFKISMLLKYFKLIKFF